MIADTNNVCACYNFFILFGANIILTRVYSDFVSAIKAAIIVKKDFDCCGRINASSYFCKFCYSIIVKKKILKFGSATCINVLSYQKYFNVLNNLIIIEEAIIIYVYLIISIIKLKLSGSGISILYHRI